MHIEPIDSDQAQDAVRGVREGLLGLVDAESGPDILSLGMAALLLGHSGLEAFCQTEDDPGLAAAHQYTSRLEGLNTAEVERILPAVSGVLEEETERLESIHAWTRFTAIAVVAYAAYYVGASTLANISGVPLDDDLGFEAAMKYAECLWPSEEAEN